MITCKICEKETLADRLADHSSKCIEVTTLRERLLSFRSIMETHAEKAALMKNSLETYSVRQKKLQGKKHFRCSSIGDGPGTPEKAILKEYRRYDSPASCGLKAAKTNFYSEFRLGKDSPVGSESQDTMDTKDSREMTEITEHSDVRETQATESHEGQEDILEHCEGKMGEEEYENFRDQVRKSTFVLKRVIAYADKINEWTFETGSMSDLDLNLKHELEILYGEIHDTKVSEFLKSFMDNFYSYLSLKSRYIRGKEDLNRIDVQDDLPDPFKIKLKLTKSISFKQKKISESRPAPIAPVVQKFKEDEAFGNALSCKETPPPAKRSLIKAFDIKSPTKTVKPLQQALSVNTNVCAAKDTLYDSLVSPGGGRGTENMEKLLRNTNHISQIGLKRSAKEGKSLRDSIKTSIKIITEGKFGFRAIDERPEIDDKRCSTPPSIEFKGIRKLSSGKKKTVAEFRTKAQDEEKAVSRENTRKEKGKKHARSNSVDLFKALRKEETVAKKDFPSLVEANNENEKKTTKKTTNKKQLTPMKTQNFENDTPLCESPVVRGYYSDTNQRAKRRTSLTEPVQVSISDFEFIKFLGKGAYGTVWLVRKKATGDLYAMKIVEWAERNAKNRLPALREEKDIYEVIQGDFVVKAIWTFQYNNYICFVTEYMIGGDLNTFLDEVGRLDEDQAAFYFAELVLAVESLHNLGIIHRDLKPENILIDNKGHIRLTDFGLSNRGLNKLRKNSTPSGRRSSQASPSNQSVNTFGTCKLELFRQLCQQNGVARDQKVKFIVKDTKTIFCCLGDVEQQSILNKKSRNIKKNEGSPLKKKSNHKVGTPDYMAPEVINPEKFGGDQANEKSLDWWSMGVILYQFLVGIPPFCGESVEEVFKNIEDLRIEWPDIGYDEDCISPEAVDLIKKLLNPDSNKRLGANGIEEIKNHKFFVKRNFDWSNHKAWEPPVVPLLSQDSEADKLSVAVSQELSDDKEKTDSLNKILDEQNGKKLMRSRTSDNVDLSAFQMRRLDVLDKLNQEAFLNIQKQKAVTLNNLY